MNPETLALIERYDRLARDLEDQTIARLDRAIDQSYRNLEREFLRQYPQIQAQGSLLASQRRAVLMNDLSSLLAIIRPDQSAEYEQLFQQMIVAAGALGGDLSGALLEAIAPNSFARAFAGINLEAAALQARDGARRLYRYNEDFQGKASATVEQGLIQGWGARRVADAMRSEMGVAKFRAETIARTEVMSALNDGAQLRYQQAGIEFVQWMATPSEGLCPLCAVRNMQVYPAGKVRVPAHPRCRCILAPWSQEWQKLGLTDDEFAGEYRDRLLGDLAQSGKQPNTGVSPFEKAAGLTRPPEPVWKPGDASLSQSQPESRLAKLRRVAAAQAPDLIVNTGGTIGSIIGGRIAGDVGALAGDLIGGLATRQVVNIAQSALSARDKLRHDADFKMASKLGQLRQLGAATLSELKSAEVQERLGNDLTGDLLGWAIGNASAIALGQVPGLSRIPLKGSVVAMQTVPRLQELRKRIRRNTT